MLAAFGMTLGIFMLVSLGLSAYCFWAGSKLDKKMKPGLEKAFDVFEYNLAAFAFFMVFLAVATMFVFAIWP